jgi:hypothetical protein
MSLKEKEKNKNILKESKNFLAYNQMQAVMPQNWHLADYSDQATIHMMSLWKRTTKCLVHVGACT